MIVRDKSSPFALLFMWRGTILPKVLPSVLIMMALSVVAQLLVWYEVYSVKLVPVVGFSVLGVILSILLAFQNTACYDRWWEGRKLWGALIANTRHFSRDTHFFEKADRRTLLIEMLIFVNLFKDRLRRKILPASCFGEYLGLDKSTQQELDELTAHHLNAPQVILERLQIHLINAVKTQKISDMIYVSIQRHVVEMGNIQAGCDRISTTPLPLAYSELLHRAVFCFCWCLPFGVGEVLGAWTPLLVGVLSYLFLGFDALAQQMEEPFGVADNDLSLDAMVRLIERETLALLGDELPKALLPKDYYLS